MRQFKSQLEGVRDRWHEPPCHKNASFSNSNAYAAYRLAEKHTEKFGIKQFLVLTVTSSAVRCKNLREAAKAAEDIRASASLFLFATEKDLPLSSPESVLTKIWTAPGRKEPYSVV